MPEGHTLHRLARLHHRRYAGHPVAVSSPQGRFAAQASLLDGRVLVRAEAYGKHLFHIYGPDAIVHVHLGLAGIFDEHKLPLAAPIGQVRMRVAGRTHWTDLRGPAACDLWTEEDVDRLRARLGPDPLRRDADPEKVWARISRSRVSIAALLMDQSVLAGVGNVYRAEILFRHGIPPMLPGKDLSEQVFKEAWTDLVDLMRDGVKVGQINTVRPEHMPEVTGREPRQDRHGGEVYVYRRAEMPCHLCGTEIRKVELAARNLYWCPTCQNPS
jgi:endonuclease VIII